MREQEAQLPPAGNRPRRLHLAALAAAGKREPAGAEVDDAEIAPTTPALGGADSNGKTIGHGPPLHVLGAGEPDLDGDAVPAAKTSFQSSRLHLLQILVAGGERIWQPFIYGRFGGEASGLFPSLGEVFRVFSRARGGTIQSMQGCRSCWNIACDATLLSCNQKETWHAFHRALAHRHSHSDYHSDRSLRPLSRSQWTTACRDPPTMPTDVNQQ